MLGQRADMAVVEVQARPAGRRTRRRCSRRGDLACAEPRDAVHLGRVDAVEVDRVRVRRAVDERDPQPLALAAAQRRAGDAPVVGPGRVLDAGRDLDLLLGRDELPLAQDLPARQLRASCPSRSRAASRAGRSRSRVVDGAAVAEVRVAAGVARPVLRAGWRWPPRLALPRVAVRDGRVQRGCRAAERGHRCGEQSAAAEIRHDNDYGMPKTWLSSGELVVSTHVAAHDSVSATVSRA